MRQYRWIITKDHISESEPNERSAVGVQGPRGFVVDGKWQSGVDENLKSNPQRFSLYDDDGNCYAEGMLYSTDAAHNYEEALFGPLDDFGTPNWGCSKIKVDGDWV